MPEKSYLDEFAAAHELLVALLRRRSTSVVRLLVGVKRTKLGRGKIDAHGRVGM